MDKRPLVKALELRKFKILKIRLFDYEYSEKERDGGEYFGLIAMKK